MRNLIVFAVVALVVALFVGGPTAIQKILHGWHRPVVESPDPAPPQPQPVVEPAHPHPRSHRPAPGRVEAVAKTRRPDPPAPTPDPVEDTTAPDVERPTEEATANPTAPDLSALASGSALLMETILDVAEMQDLGTTESEVGGAR